MHGVTPQSSICILRIESLVLFYRQEDPAVGCRECRRDRETGARMSCAVVIFSELDFIDC